MIFSKYFYDVLFHYGLIDITYLPTPFVTGKRTWIVNVFDWVLIGFTVNKCSIVDASAYWIITSVSPSRRHSACNLESPLFFWTQNVKCLNRLLIVKRNLKQICWQLQQKEIGIISHLSPPFIYKYRLFAKKIRKTASIVFIWFLLAEALRKSCIIVVDVSCSVLSCSTLGRDTSSGLFTRRFSQRRKSIRRYRNPYALYNRTSKSNSHVHGHHASSSTNETYYANCAHKESYCLWSRG